MKINRQTKIYSLSHGSATKYYWFNIINNVTQENNFEDKIKTVHLTFSKYSGTTEADCHGSTLALNFFSDRLTKILEEYSPSTFLKYKIDTHTKLGTKNIYYFIEPTSSIPIIQNKDIFSQPDIDKYCTENNTKKTSILILSADIYFTYADFGKWNGDDIFTVVNTRHIFITEKMKLLLNSNSLKNIEIEEVNFLE